MEVGGDLTMGLLVPSLVPMRRNLTPTIVHLTLQLYLLPGKVGAGHDGI